MQDKLEKIIKLAYKKWKSDSVKIGVHPNEQDLACFLENRLAEKDNQHIKAHLISCDSCAEFVANYIKLKAVEADIPNTLLVWAKDLVGAKDKISLLEIYLRLKEKALEILNTTGDVLVNQELVPAPILRSRQIKDFKDEVIILKDFKDIRVEVKVENKRGQAFSLTVIVKEKSTQKIMKDLRVTLIKDDLELESYLADSGSATFEHVLLGKYRVEISDVNTKLASVLLDVKI